MKAASSRMSDAPKEADPARARFAFLGGDPSVDFVNTVDEWLGDAPTDRLESYGDLLEWAEEAGLLDGPRLSSLKEEASKRPDAAERVLRRARSFRASLYRILVAAVSGEPPDREDLTAITASARRANAHSRLAPRKDGFAWALDAGSGRDLEGPVWELARSAVALLTSESLQRIRQCADETCGWLFIDRSRNRSRRWCDMSSCGNRAKARRNYARRRARRPGADD